MNDYTELDGSLSFDDGIDGAFDIDGGMDGSMDIGGVTVVCNDDYEALMNKPSIEGHVLEGDSTIQQIGVGTLTVQEIEKILYHID